MDTLNLDVDGNALSDHYAVGTATELRFGRYPQPRNFILYREDY